MASIHTIPDEILKAIFQYCKLYHVDTIFPSITTTTVHSTNWSDILIISKRFLRVGKTVFAPTHWDFVLAFNREKDDHLIEILKREVIDITEQKKEDLIQDIIRQSTVERFRLVLADKRFKLSEKGHKELDTAIRLCNSYFGFVRATDIMEKMLSMLLSLDNVDPNFPCDRAGTLPLDLAIRIENVVATITLIAHPNVKLKLNPNLMDYFHRLGTRDREYFSLLLNALPKERGLSIQPMISYALKLVISTWPPVKLFKEMIDAPCVDVSYDNNVLLNSALASGAFWAIEVILQHKDIKPEGICLRCLYDAVSTQPQHAFLSHLLSNPNLSHLGKWVIECKVCDQDHNSECDLKEHKERNHKRQRD